MNSQQANVHYSGLTGNPMLMVKMLEMDNSVPMCVSPVLAPKLTSAYNLFATSLGLEIMPLPTQIGVLEAIVYGDQDEADSMYGKIDGYVELSKVLNEIFDPPIQYRCPLHS